MTPPITTVVVSKLQRNVRTKRDAMNKSYLDAAARVSRLIDGKPNGRTMFLEKAV